MPPIELQIDLTPRIKKLKIFATERSFSRRVGGEWVSSTKGQGLEFAGYRAYLFGDDARLIDWKASLRTKELVVREFEEERIANIVFLLDVSNTMLFSSHRKLKAEYAAELVNSLSNGILNSGDAVGLIMFSEEIKKSVYPETGPKHYNIISSAISDPELYGGGYSLINALKYAIKKLKGNAMLIIVSDFIGLEEEWYKWLEISSKMFEVIGICVRDPVDRRLPKEGLQLLMEDPLTGEKLLIDSKQYAERYNTYIRKQEKMLEEWFAKTRSGFIILDTKKDYVEPILRFFHARYRVKR